MGKLKNGDRDAEEKLIKINSALIWSVARRFTSFAESDDLYQVGAMGLIKAARRFDASFNVRFSTYAVPMMLGEIRRYLRDDNMIKISRYYKESAAKVKRGISELTGELGREPKMSELSERLNMDESDISAIIDANERPVSLSQPASNNGDEKYTLEKVIAGNDDEERIIDKVTVVEAIDRLDERERAVISLRYYKNRTQSETAKVLGISQVQVSRMEKKILKKMRSVMT